MPAPRQQARQRKEPKHPGHPRAQYGKKRERQEAGQQAGQRKAKGRHPSGPDEAVNAEQEHKNEHVTHHVGVAGEGRRRAGKAVLKYRGQAPKEGRNEEAPGQPRIFESAKASAQGQAKTQGSNEQPGHGQGHLSGQACQAAIEP